MVHFSFKRLVSAPVHLIEHTAHSGVKLIKTVASSKPVRTASSNVKHAYQSDIQPIFSKASQSTVKLIGGVGDAGSTTLKAVGTTATAIGATASEVPKVLDVFSNPVILGLGIIAIVMIMRR